ncbi:hypothetical protein LB519_04280 [Mesorhizobium sp. AD1-1]|uniref:hypothetical protein n=1 Tax=Mesorhizobium sp. AD1-1 TaxID=2876621 RepID=UPI001CCD45D1|nr:hypothetical protein [Mesorhizobium sp. AD1-1]MBZ9717055.1 hypothetical protein [Mesorhizobium sp. AD1-1]
MMAAQGIPNLKGNFRKAAARRRRRRARVPTARPFSIRLSDDERALLTREAGKVSLAAHMRRKLLGESVSTRGSVKPSRKRRVPSIDQVALGKALALLGQAELSRRLDELAMAAMMGALPVTPELVQELHAVCAHIRAMREALMDTLNVSRGFDGDSGR